MGYTRGHVSHRFRDRDRGRAGIRGADVRRRAHTGGHRPGRCSATSSARHLTTSRAAFVRRFTTASPRSFTLALRARSPVLGRRSFPRGAETEGRRIAFRRPGLRRFPRATTAAGGSPKRGSGGVSRTRTHRSLSIEVSLTSFDSVVRIIRSQPMASALSRLPHAQGDRRQVWTVSRGLRMVAQTDAGRGGATERADRGSGAS